MQAHALLFVVHGAFANMQEEDRADTDTAVTYQLMEMAIICKLTAEQEQAAGDLFQYKIVHVVYYLLFHSQRNELSSR